MALDHMRMFRCEGRYYGLEGIKGEGVRIVEPTPSEVRELIQSGEDVPGLGLSLQDLRACFAGTMLERGQRIAALGATRFSILFGEARKDTFYAHADFLRRVGRRIPPPPPPPHAGCGKCTDLTKTCGAGCSRRLVQEALQHATFAMLNAAIRHTDPVEQVEAAISARIDTECAPRKRTPHDYAVKGDREEWEDVNGAYRFAGR